MAALVRAPSAGRWPIARGGFRGFGAGAAAPGPWVAVGAPPAMAPKRPFCLAVKGLPRTVPSERICFALVAPRLSFAEGRLPAIAEHPVPLGVDGGGDLHTSRDGLVV